MSLSESKIPAFLVVLAFGLALGPLFHFPDTDQALVKSVVGVIILMAMIVAWLAASPRGPAEKSGGRSKLENAAQSAERKADEVKGEGAYVGLRDRVEGEDNAANGGLGRASRGPLSLRFDLDSILWLAILLFAGASAITAVDKIAAIFGGYVHHFGLLTLALLIGAFFLLRQIEWTPRYYRFLLLVLVAGGVIQALVAFAQVAGGILGFEVFGVGLQRFRSAGTLGNANIFGSYMVPLIPLSYGLARMLTGRAKLVAYGAAFLMFLAVLSTLSIAAWLAIMAMGVVLLVDRFRHGALDKGVIFVFTGGLAVLAGFFLLSTSGMIRVNMLSRIVAAANVSTGSLGSRLQLWKAAGRLVLGDPLLGWGPDSFRFAAPGSGLLSGVLELAAHPHNLILEFAANLGLPAAMLFIVVVARFLIRFWRRSSPGPGAFGRYDLRLWLGLAVVGQLVITLVQSLNFFPFLLFMTLIAAQAGLEPPDRQWTVSVPMVVRIGTTALALGLLTALVWGGGRVLAAEQAYRRGLAADEMSAPAVALTKRAIRLNPYFVVYRYRLARIYLTRIEADPDDIDYARGLEVVRAGKDLQPLDPTFHLIEARLHEYSQEVDGVKLAIEAANRALDAHPRSAVVRRLLGGLYMGEKKYRVADKNYTHAVNSDPTSFYLWFRLGLARYKARDRAGALEAYGEAARIRPTSQSTQMMIGLIQAREHQESGTAEGLSKSIVVAEEVLKIQSQSHIARLIIADSYFQRGDYEEAALHYAQAAELRPGSFYIWYQLGKSQHRSQDETQALEAYREAVKIKPVSPGAMTAIEEIENGMERGIQ